MGQVKIVSSLCQRLEWKVRLFVQAQEACNGLCNEVLGPLGTHRAVLPDDASRIHEPVAAHVELKDKLLAVPEAPIVIVKPYIRILYGKVKLLHRLVEDEVLFDEDAGSQLKTLRGVIIGVDGDTSSTNMIRLFEDGDVDWDVELFGVLA